MGRATTEAVIEEKNGEKNSAAEPNARDLGGKYLTFYLAGEEYGIEILKVREIMGIMNITSVPRTPGFILGVINLRGKVIPVIDLRLKFSMETGERTEETCIIVVQTAGMEMGIVVDKVSEVLDLMSEDIDNAPSFGADVNTEYILGIGKTKGEIKLLLDIEKVFSTQEVEELQLSLGTESEEPDNPKG